MSRANAVSRALSQAVGTGRCIRTYCPFCAHHTHNKRNLQFDKLDGHWYCFRCQSWGRLPGWQPQEEYARSTPGIQTYEPPETWMELGATRNSVNYRALDYAITKRKLRPSNIAAAKLGMVTRRDRPEDDEQDWRNRLIVPITAPDGTWLGYVGRDYTGRAYLPYMYVRGMDRGQILYNQAEVFRTTDEPLLIVEGTLDAVYCWPSAVALLGMWTDHQIELLCEANRPLVTLLDGDAWRKGEALSEILQINGKRSGAIRLPPKLDPDDMTMDWIREETRRCLR